MKVRITIGVELENEYQLRKLMDALFSTVLTDDEDAEIDWEIIPKEDV